MGGDDQPGPPVGGLRAADLGGGPAQDLLEQPEGVFQVEPAARLLLQRIDEVLSFTARASVDM